MSNSVIPLCNSKDLQEGDLAVPFDVVYDGQTCRAFAIRFEGQAQAYLNRCSHVAMELDFQPNRVFDNSCLLYTSPSPRDRTRSRMPSSA